MVKDLTFWIQFLSFPFRKSIRNKNISGKRVVLDYLKLEGTNLTNCEIVYYGSGSIHLVQCNINKCTFTLSGKAGSTLLYLKHIGRLSPEVIKKTFPDVFEDTN